MPSTPFGHHFAKHPIKIVRSKPVRVYLINVIEFDPINSLHLHANFFDYYDHGTTLTPTLQDGGYRHAMPGAARHS